MGLTANIGPKDDADDDASHMTMGSTFSAMEDHEDAETSPDTDEEPSTDEQDDDVKDKVVLFSINGTDYYVPKKPGPNVAIKHMRDMRKHGIDYANAGLLEAMVGTEGMDALADYEDLTDDDLEQVMEAVQKLVFGKGKKRGGKSPKKRR